MVRLGTKGAAAVTGLILALMLSGVVTRPFTLNEKAFYADPEVSLNPDNVPRS